MKALILSVFIFCIGLAHADPYVIFSDNGKKGIKDERGQVIIPPSFDALGWSDGSFSVIGNVTGYRTNNQWGVINLKNEFITKADYESLVYAGADNIVVRKRINPAQVKAGCINLQGEVKIPFQYEGISIHGLRAIVFNLERAKYVYGLIDLENHILIPIRYKNIYPLGTLRYAVENESGKIALHGENGKPITDFQIDSISQFRDSKAIIYENLKQGLIDRDGNIKLPSIYRSVQITGENKVRVEPPYEWFFITDKNEIVNRFSADELIPVNEKLFIIKTSGKYGLIDNDLKLVCPVLYDILNPMGDDFFLARKAGKMGVIKSNNTITVPFVYDSLYAGDKVLRAFRKIEGWSLIDRNNVTLTLKNYDWIGSQKKNLLPVINNHYWGVVSITGEEIVHCVFDSLVEISNDLLVVKFKNQYGIINSHEDWLVAPQPLPIHLINNQLYSQKQSSNILLKNFKGEIVYFTDNRLEYKEDHFIEYLTDGTEKTIDYQGRLMNRVSPPAISNVERIFKSSEGMRGVKRDGKFGFIDERGRLRIANRYDDVGEFHEGLAAFKLIGKWGFLNTSDQVIINPNYEKVSNFQNGLAIAYRGGKSGVINKKGNPILTFQYDSIHCLPNKKFLLFAGGRSGLADENGSILIDPRFDHLSQLDNELVLVGIDGKSGALTSSGLNVIPIIYERLSFDKKHNLFLAFKKSEWKEVEVK
jgi:WG containing repeat